MYIEFTKEEQELLKHAEGHCLCESYYRYICTKCKATGRGFVTSRHEAYTRLRGLDIVKHDSYHGLMLTDAGKKLWQSFKDREK